MAVDLTKKRGYYVDASGKHISYEYTAQRIKSEFPQLIGEHIFAQLDALGLSEAFNGGQTPCSLPYSFI